MPETNQRVARERYDQGSARTIAPPGSCKAEGTSMRKIGIMTFMLLALAFMARTSGPLPVSAQASVTCNLLTPTIIATQPGPISGTSGDDVIVGTAGDDIIDAGAGNDTICGEGGNDIIRAGDGNDQMWGEA